MTHHVPKTAAILTIVGGVFVLLGGLALAAIGAIFSFLLGGLTGLFFIGLVIGILILVFGVLMFVKPEMKLIWGILTIIMAIVSIPFAFGGFLIGFILSLIGGIMAITYKVREPTPMMYPPGTMAPPPPPPPPPA